MLLVRALSREEYGAYIALVALFEILQLGSNLGGFAAVFRYVPEFRSRNEMGLLQRLTRDLVVFRVITLTVCAAFLATASEQISGWLEMPWLADILHLYAVVVIFEGLARFTDQLFDSLLLQAYSQLSILLRNGLRLLGLAMLGGASLSNIAFDLEIWIVVEAVASFTGALLSVFLVMRRIKWQPASEIVPEREIDYQRITAYAFPAYLSQIVGLAQGPDMVKLLVARLADAIQTGAFGFAAALNGMLQRYLPVFLLIGMVRPLFVSARAQGRSNNELVALASLIFKLNVFVIAPFLSVLAVMGDPIGRVLSGGKFPEAGTYLVALLILLLFQTLRTVMGLLALVAEESKAGLYGSVVGIGGIIVGIAGFPHFGPLALCAGLVLSEMLWCLVMQKALARHALTFTSDLKGMLKIGGAAFLTVASLFVIRPLLPSTPIVALLIATTLAIGVFLVSTLGLKPFLKSERDLINRALPRPLFVW